MNIAIVGSRNFKALNKVDDFVKYLTSLDEPITIISGGAKGVDLRAVFTATNYKLKTKNYLPDWSMGKQAGILRNIDIVNNSDYVIAFWNGYSKGTKHSIDYAKSKSKPVIVVLE